MAKALEKDKARRYASAGELAADLRRYLARRADPGPAAVGAVPASASSPGGTRRWWAACWASSRRCSLGTIVSVAVRRAGRAERPGRRSTRSARRRSRRTRPGWPPRSRRCRHTTWPTPRRQLDAAPEELRDWEWRHLHSRLDDSSAVIPLPAGEAGLPAPRPGSAPGRDPSTGDRPAPHGPGGRRADDGAADPLRARGLSAATQTRRGLRVVGVGREHGLRPAGRGRPGPLSRGHPREPRSPAVSP